MKTPRKKHVRYAVLGLGHIAQVAVLPAFRNARENSELAALITGDPAKEKQLSRKYGVPAFHYDDFEQAVAEQQIDAVYIASPNAEHRTHTERAARAGVHVLCEKPMAGTEADCRAMIAACDRAKVRLMIAYRLHFHDAHLQAIQLARSGKLGEIRSFASVFNMQVAKKNVRNEKEQAGGPLFDIGVYCINAARYLFGSEPSEVFAFCASNGDPRFAEVEEMSAALLRFPGDRLASFVSSFNSESAGVIELSGTKGKLRMDPAFDYSGEIKWTVSIGGKKQKKTFPAGDQFAPELLHFSDCILRNKKAEPDGNEGWADVRIINALHKSAKTGRPVPVTAVLPQKSPRASNAKRRPPAREPRVVGAKAPNSSH